MIKSMTGFGRAEAVSKERKVSVELKSVNHRYLDLNIKMPKRLSYFEGEIRNVMKTYIRRGKVDVFITYEDYTMGGMALKYNSELAKEYLGYLNQMSEELGIENDIRVSTLSRYPDVFTMEEQAPDEEALWSFLEGPLHEACRKFVETREREGVNLKRELLEDNQIDDSRIAAEVILFSDKICNDEETVRLRSHIHGMRKILDENEGVGRKMDFMAQEMNREANTILSKSNDLTVSNAAIDLKTEIEKIREQIQNIE